MTALPDDVRLLVAVLPEALAAALPPALDDLLEIVLDLGRPAEARFADRVVPLGPAVTRPDLEHVVARVGEFGADNRAGIERTLHRISAIHNRRGQIVGLTLRVGRAVFGTVDMLRDLVDSGASLLLLGRPGVGKTTKLREVARLLADAGKRVMIVDTSNEIAGDGDVPHPGIGAARRMQVPRVDRQHDVMIEAIENHMPEVIVVDEIGTAAEAAAARTIAERGVQLVGTAHGNTIDNLVLNPTLADLIGGIETVTLGDDEARRRGTAKTIRERRGPPTFGVVVEIVDRDTVRVHRDAARAVDRLLAGLDSGGEVRRLGQAPEPTEVDVPAPKRGPIRIYPHALSRDLLRRVLRDLPVDVQLVDRMEKAEVVLALRSRVDDPRLARSVEATGARVFAIKRGTGNELRRALRTALHIVEGAEPGSADEAAREAEAAIARVSREGVAVSLRPRPARIRQLQHRLVARAHLEAASTGEEPLRHLVIFPADELTVEE